MDYSNVDIKVERSISENEGTHDIPQSTVSQMYCEYLIEDITTYCGQCSGQQWSLNAGNQRYLARSHSVQVNLVFFMFCQVWEPKTHQGTPFSVLTPRHIALPWLMTLLIELWKTGMV